MSLRQAADEFAAASVVLLLLALIALPVGLYINDRAASRAFQAHCATTGGDYAHGVCVWPAR